jgi:hypothetical protein
VNRCSDGSPGDYDAVCLRTRLITIARLLERLDRWAEADAWLADRGELERAAWQRNDRLLCQGDIQRVQASRVGEGLR